MEISTKKQNEQQKAKTSNQRHLPVLVFEIELIEGEEGVKWELGFALFLTGKLGLAFLGLGCLKVGMGNKILKMGLGYINCKMR